MKSIVSVHIYMHLLSYLINKELLKANMEYDRLGGNNKMFLFGIICLVISLGLLFFSLYILPYLIWELSYGVPDFILTFLAKFEDDYHYSVATSKTLVWLIFFIPCLVTGLISYFVSRYLDKKMYGEELGIPPAPEKPAGEVQRQIKESASLGGKILALMICIVVVILLLQFVIQS